LWCQWIHQFVFGGIDAAKVNDVVAMYFQTKKDL